MPGGITSSSTTPKGQAAPAQAPAPALSTRRSSDSTVGIADSPQMLPEGLKTDEEDCGGRRACGGGGGGIDFAPPAPPDGRAKLAGTMSGDGEGGADQAPSTCESVGGDTTTQVGSFYLPGTSAGGSAGLHPETDGARGGGCGRAAAAGGGDDADGLEMASEAGLMVVTAAETPAASSGIAARAAAAASEERAGGGGGGSGGCLLDAYREPEGHDWGELEDWQGLPGLQLAGGGGGGVTARLQVTSSQCCFLEV